jgi:hypothetical protein
MQDRYDSALEIIAVFERHWKQEKLYQKIRQAPAESLCRIYLREYPQGWHIDEVRGIMHELMIANEEPSDARVVVKVVVYAGFILVLLVAGVLCVSKFHVLLPYTGLWDPNRPEHRTNQAELNFHSSNRKAESLIAVGEEKYAKAQKASIPHRDAVVYFAQGIREWEELIDDPNTPVPTDKMPELLLKTGEAALRAAHICDEGAWWEGVQVKDAACRSSYESQAREFWSKALRSSEKLESCHSNGILKAKALLIKGRALTGLERPMEAKAALDAVMNMTGMPDSYFKRAVELHGKVDEWTRRHDTRHYRYRPVRRF